MDYEELEKTKTWELYEKSLNYCQLIDLFNKSDIFNRFYIGDQWNGLKLSKSVEPVCLNICKQIVDQKTSRVTDNLFAINYSPENGDNEDFIQKAQDVCKSLNKYASKIWDFDQMDYKIKSYAKRNAIVGQVINYIDYKDKTPINSAIKNTDIFVGDENSTDIQKQPYIIVRQRKNIIDVQEYAKKHVSDEKVKWITGDNDTETISGQKEELDDKVWLLTKFWKDSKGNVHYSKGVKYLEIEEDVEMGISLYPFAVWNWAERDGSFRGVGEIEYIKPNQLEINKTELRRLITVKNISYPQKVVNEDAISNINDVDKVGATIRFKDVGGLRASDVFMNTTPAQMGTDAEKVQAELINLTKDLTNVSEATTGNLDPSSASGRAILAVQQAQNQPLNDQVIGLKKFIEDIARIWFEYWKKNCKDLIVFYSEKDVRTGDVVIKEAKVDKETMKRLEAFVKVDITPRGAYDRYAQELSLENLMQAGFLSFEEYVESLDADSVMPKTKLERILKERQEKQALLNQIDIQATELKNQANQQVANAEEFSGIEGQASSMMAQALQEAQETSHGNDTQRSNVSNNVNLG